MQQEGNGHAFLTAKIYCTFACFVDLFQSILMYDGQRLKLKDTNREGAVASSDLLSVHRMWILNRDRFPDRLLRNVNQLYIVPHNYATLKRLPLYNFPNLWNHEPDEKQHRYLKNLKKLCLVNFV